MIMPASNEEWTITTISAVFCILIILHAIFGPALDDPDNPIG